MTLPPTICVVEDCRRRADYVVRQVEGPGPFCVAAGDWLCERDRRVVELLAERFCRTVVVEPRWRVYAETVPAPF